SCRPMPATATTRSDRAEPSALQQHLQHGGSELAEGRAQQRGAVQPALIENALAMREGLEADLAVIGANPRRADAAERQILDEDVHERLVDGGATRDRALKHAV